jgi:hypothetical protein
MHIHLAIHKCNRQTNGVTKQIFRFHWRSKHAIPSKVWDLFAIKVVCHIHAYHVFEKENIGASLKFEDNLERKSFRIRTRTKSSYTLFAQ